MSNIASKHRNTMIFAVVLGATALFAYAAFAFGPSIVWAIARAPLPILVAVGAVSAVGAGFFTWPQLRLHFGDRQRSRLRANLNPVVDQGIGSGDAVLDMKPTLDPAVKESYFANHVQVRYPPAGFTGKPRVASNGTLRVDQPITAGMDARAAIQFASAEDREIRAANSLARDLVNGQFKNTNPALVQTFVGAHYEKGTTGSRTIAFQGDALSWEDAEYSILHLMHEPVTRRPRWSRGGHETVTDAAEEQAAASNAPARRLRFLIPRPSRAQRAAAPKIESARQPRVQVDFPLRDRSDLLVKGLTNWAHGAVSLARVESGADHARVDRKIRDAAAVAAIAAQWGTAMSGGALETKRLARELGCGFIGSFAEDVFHVPSRGSITSVIQRFSLHGVRTLEGYSLHPGDADEDRRGRRVVLFAYGAPDVVREVPESIRKALGIAAHEFFNVSAGVPNMSGVRFTLLVEASADELESAYPGITEHPGWVAFMDGVEKWNEVKCEDDAVMFEEVA